MQLGRVAGWPPGRAEGAAGLARLSRPPGAEGCRAGSARLASATDRAADQAGPGAVFLVVNHGVLFRWEQWTGKDRTVSRSSGVCGPVAKNSEEIKSVVSRAALTFSEAFSLSN